jgi:hypothetical protein
MDRRLEIVVVALVALGAAIVGAGIAYYFAHPARVEIAGAEARNVLLSPNAPTGTVETEENSTHKAGAAAAPGAQTSV